MKTTAFNPAQLHILKMFSYAKTEESLDDLKKALSAYYAKLIDKDMEQLWESGLWDDEKNEGILAEDIHK